MGELEASPSGSSHKNCDARCLFGPKPSLLRLKVVEGFLPFANCMAHCWGGVYGERVSAFPNFFNVGIFLVTQCVGVFLVSGFFSEVLIHVKQFIESMGGRSFAYSDIPSNAPPDLFRAS